MSVFVLLVKEWTPLQPHECSSVDVIERDITLSAATSPPGVLDVFQELEQRASRGSHHHVPTLYKSNRYLRDTMLRAARSKGNKKKKDRLLEIKRVTYIPPINFQAYKFRVFIETKEKRNVYKARIIYLSSLLFPRIRCERCHSTGRRVGNPDAEVVEHRSADARKKICSLLLLLLLFSQPPDLTTILGVWEERECSRGRVTFSRGRTACCGGWS